MTMMNEQDRERFLATMRHDDDFRAAVRRELLSEELLNLPKTVATLIDVAAQQRQDLQTVAQDLRSLTQDVRSLNEIVATLGDVVAQQGEDIRSLAQAVSTLVDSVAEQRQDFSALVIEVRDMMQGTITFVGEGFSAIGGEISELRTEMRAGFTAVDAKFDQVNAEIVWIKDQLAA